MSTGESIMHTYLHQVVARGKLELIDELAHADMVDEANAAFGGPPGRAGLVAHARGFLKHVQDVEVSVKQIVGNEHQAMGWWSFEGTLAGPWLGRKPTGERFSAEVFSFFELREGRVARYRLWLHAALTPPAIFDSQTALSARELTGPK